MEEMNIEKLLDELIAKASGPVIQKLTEEDLKHLDDAYPYEISKEHEEKMKEIFKQADHITRANHEIENVTSDETEKATNNNNISEFKSEHIIGKKRTFKKVLVVAAILIIVFTIGCVCAFRDSFVKYYLNIKEECSGVKKNAVIQDYSVDNIKFGYMPSEYSLKTKRINDYSYLISFKNDIEKYITLEIKEKEYDEEVNTEDGKIEEMMINDKDMVYTERDNLMLLTWREGSKIIVVSTNTNKELLLRVVKNIIFLD